MKGGRPTKLTREIVDKIVRLVGVGNYMETAAATCGISKDTLYRWLKQGARQGKGLARDLADGVYEATARCEAHDVAFMHKAAETDWRAAAWRMERRNPERWGRVRIEHTGADGGPIQVQADWRAELGGVVYSEEARSALATLVSLQSRAPALVPDQPDVALAPAARKAPRKPKRKRKQHGKVAG
jgi:hypothetical protein